MTALHRLAEAYGLALSWWDIGGTEHHVSEETLEALLHAMGVDTNRCEIPARGVDMAILGEPGQAVLIPNGAPDEAFRIELETGEIIEDRLVESENGVKLPKPLPLGIHKLTLLRRHPQSYPCIIAPERCLGPEAIGIEKGFGVAVQLYGLRSKRSSPIGDFEDLRITASAFAETGADFLGLSPLHALFPAFPKLCSPYSPSSRRFINLAFIGTDGGPEDDGLIDYETVMPKKLEALRRRYRQIGEGERQELASFREAGGTPLQHHCLFDALHASKIARDANDFMFWDWPEGLRRPDTLEVQRFAEQHEDEIGFFAYLQLLADRQLAQAQESARAGGMKLGLYRDLAVGVHPAGSMVWANPGLSLRDVSIGAPPDPLSPQGQYWDLSPFSPSALAAQNFRPLYDDLAANTHHAGALRIDHVIGFERQFWIPRGMEPRHGTYVRFPFQIMCRLASLASHRNRCLVIGEDLGTVPEGFRERMAQAGMLSCKVLWFEREGNKALSPNHFPRQALASISTHDLPTIRGFFEHRDITWREKLSLFPDQNAIQREHDGRNHDKDCLMRALQAEDIDSSDLIEALSRYLARSKAVLTIVQLEDLAAELEQANLPGTIDEHPNWRRRMNRPVEDLLADPRVQRLLHVIENERQQ